MELRRIPPGNFTMGASRREQGRRSNETLRSVRLERPFAMGVREVTNAEYAQFDAAHRSGMAGTIPLGARDRPVVQVSWNDAARFCNWLSRRDGLEPAYEPKDGQMHAVSPMTRGYRLPTEAEWEYAARMGGSGAPLKYPWGARFPPRDVSGNYADEAAAPGINRIIEGYDDTYAGPAPVASFDRNAFGLFDMGGNVSEWCHDFYGVYTYNPREIVVDPMGPDSGRHRVVRGSNWRNSSISALRFSYRDYSDAKRDDLGFRICRYLSDAEASTP